MVITTEVSTDTSLGNCRYVSHASGSMLFQAHRYLPITAFGQCHIMLLYDIDTCVPPTYQPILITVMGQGADLHMAQLMPLPLTVSCINKSKSVLPSWFYLSGAGSPG